MRSWIGANVAEILGVASGVSAMTSWDTFTQFLVQSFTFLYNKAIKKPTL